MFRVIVIVLALALGTSGAFAAANWNGAGWYRIMEGDDGGDLEAGPFADESACRATLPADNDDYFDWFCQYFATDPPGYD